jgi:hypothetical protein
MQFIKTFPYQRADEQPVTAQRVITKRLEDHDPYAGGELERLAAQVHNTHVVVAAMVSLMSPEQQRALVAAVASDYETVNEVAR